MTIHERKEFFIVPLKYSDPLEVGWQYSEEEKKFVQEEGKKLTVMAADQVKTLKSIGGAAGILANQLAGVPLADDKTFTGIEINREKDLMTTSRGGLGIRTRLYYKKDK